MESTDVVAVESAPAPVVNKTESSVSESSQQVKVEQVSNGTVETSVSQKKEASQKMETSVQQVAGGEVSSVKVEEVKQESFSSSSVVVEDKKPAEEVSVPAASEQTPIPEPEQTTEPIQDDQTKNVVVNGVDNVETETPVDQIEESKVETETEIKTESEVPKEEIQPQPIETPVESEPVPSETPAVAEPEPKAPAPVVEQEVPVETTSQSESVQTETETPKLTVESSKVADHVVKEKITLTETQTQTDDTLLYHTEASSQTSVEEKLRPEEKVVTTGDGLVVSSVESIEPQIVAEPDVNNNNVVVPDVPAPIPAPVEIAAPVCVEKPVEILPQLAQTESITKEIQQENIKKQLNEIITDIEQHVNVNDEENHESKLDPKNPVDLQKIFTPATDTEEIQPGKNRKLFASSSFYSPTIHPTVEDQVALAQRISHSLSDISNQQSKGQSMYVNRKKRSVKWIHDNGGVEEQQSYEETRETKENGFDSQMNGNVVEPKKVPLKLLMDPRGHVHDYQSSRDCGYEPAPMSPEFGIELVNALNAPKGKGAELFAKRRKKAEKWVVDGSNVQQRTTPSATTPTANATILAFSDVGTQRVQRNIQMDQIQQRYLNQQPRVQMIKSPWEAALETGSANNAFATTYDQAAAPQTPGQIYSATAGQQQQYEYGSTQSSMTSSQTSSSFQSQLTKKNVEYQSSKQIMEQLSKRDLAYKPSVPQGWNRPKVVLPSGIFTPPEIPVYSHTSSTTTEKYSKFTSQSSTTNQSGAVPFPNMPINDTPAFSPAAKPAQAPQPQQQQAFVPKPQAQQKPIQNSIPQSFPPKSPVQFNQAPAVAPQQFQPKICSPPTVAVSAAPKISPPLSMQRVGLNASPVTPGILKKQIQLDAAVPIPPGSGIAPSTPSAGQPTGLSGTKSPVPIFNTTPTPFGFPAGHIQTPETVAQLAPISPAPSPMPRSASTKPLPLIVSTPIPKFTANYNLAAAGWGASKDVYRSVQMQNVKKLVPPTVYTDF